MVSLALTMAVMTTNIYNKKDGFSYCPRWIIHLAKKLRPNYILPLDRYHQSGQQIKSQEDNHDPIGGEEPDAINPIESKSNTYSHTPQGFDMERSNIEWKMVAEVVDQISFWIYLLGTSLVQGILFF